MPDQQFGMLAALPDSTIQVLHRLECDHTTKFKWDNSSKRLLRLPPDEEK